MSTMDAINSNEDKYMIKVSEDDAINAKFNTKLQELLDIAHSKKNVIEDTELIKHFNDLKEVALASLGSSPHLIQNLLNLGVVSALLGSIDSVDLLLSDL